jgi:hypothetical protein
VQFVTLQAIKCLCGSFKTEAEIQEKVLMTDISRVSEK